MASSAAWKGSGTTITFASGFFAQITDINWTGASRPAIPLPHMNLAAAGAGKFGNLPKVPGDVVDPGELEVTFNFNPDTLPPLEAAAESCTLTFDEGATWAGSAFMREFSTGVPMDGVMSGRAILAFSGNITVTADT